MEVSERNMWVMEIKYFEFSFKLYYLEHLELKMILSTKYLNNLRPFTKQVKNDKEKQWKKFEADVWKIFLVWLLAEWNHITRTSTSLLQFLEKLFLWRT